MNRTFDMEKEKIKQIGVARKGNYRILKVNNTTYVLSCFWYYYSNIISLLEDKFIIDEKTEEKIKELF